MIQNNIKIDEKSYKNILIYYNEYVTIKDLKYVNINSVNPLYLIIKKVNRYFEEINGNKYLTLIPTVCSYHVTYAFQSESTLHSIFA